jgi:cell division protein FtsQ
VTAPTQDRPRVHAPIDPRIRDRRIEVIREAGRRRLRITLVIASAIVVVGLVYLAIRSPLLDVDRIRVTGNRRESVSQIVDAARVHTGDALLLVNRGAIERRVERLPWVASVHVRRELPHTLEYVVTEYAPTAYVRIGPHRVALVASTGRVIQHAPAAPPNAVQVLGERAVPAAGALLADPDVADVVRKLPPRLGAQVRAIEVGGASITLVLRTPSTPSAPQCTGGGPTEQIRLGTLADLADKGAAALAVVDHLAGQPFTYVDVATPQAPVSC